VSGCGGLIRDGERKSSVAEKEGGQIENIKSWKREEAFLKGITLGR